MDNNGLCISLIFLAFVVSSLIGTIAHEVITQQWRDQAITNQCAYYHPDTGDFKWFAEKKDGKN